MLDMQFGKPVRFKKKRNKDWPIYFWAPCMSIKLLRVRFSKRESTHCAKSEQKSGLSVLQ